MAKTATINVRIDPNTKSDAEKLFSYLGMSISEAITIFLHKSLIEGGLPFDVKQPRYNKETELAMQEARSIMKGELPAKRYSSAGELFAELDAEEE
jgi:DNA-damage-inducible protein J